MTSFQTISWLSTRGRKWRNKWRNWCSHVLPLPQQGSLSKSKRDVMEVVFFQPSSFLSSLSIRLLMAPFSVGWFAEVCFVYFFCLIVKCLKPLKPLLFQINLYLPPWNCSFCRQTNLYFRPVIEAWKTIPLETHTIKTLHRKPHWWNI